MICVYLIQGVRTLISIRQSLKFVKKNTKKPIDSSDTVVSSKKLHIFIPCLQEQENIPNTLAYFYENTKNIRENVNIYTITTEVEKKYTESNFTWDIINNEIKSHDYINVSNIHYTKNTGYMAHQLNFAIDTLKKKNVISHSDYVVLYNADSRPHPNTFNWVLKNSDSESNLVYQQLSIVFKNFSKFSNRLNGIILKSFAVWQTRFSLAHEFPRLRRTTSKNRIISEYSNAHCIGHGLFIPFSKLENLGGFSENTVTEDLFLGYLLRATGSKIKPIPYFENIDSPTTIWRNMRQKYIWFWGPMYYPYYFKYFIEKFNNKRFSFKAFVLMAQGVLSALSWSVSGLLLLASIILVLFSPLSLLSIILSVLIFVYSVAQYIYILNNYSFLIKLSTNENQPNLSQRETLFISLISPLVIILCSIPTYISLITEIRRCIFKTSFNKPKTES